MDDHDHWFIRVGGRCIVCGAPYYARDRKANVNTYPYVPPTIDELISTWGKAAQYERVCRDNAEFESEINYRTGRAEIYELLASELNSLKEGRPIIVCLCGSTRFSEAFKKANFDETLAGRIVLTIGCDSKSDEALGLTEQDKTRLDKLHKRKIDLADEILVLNVNGYIGESTQSEIDYATRRNKRVRYLA